MGKRMLRKKDDLYRKDDEQNLGERDTETGGKFRKRLYVISIVVVLSLSASIGAIPFSVMEVNYDYGVEVLEESQEQYLYQDETKVNYEKYTEATPPDEIGEDMYETTTFTPEDVETWIQDPPMGEEFSFNLLYSDLWLEPEMGRELRIDGDEADEAGWDVALCYLTEDGHSDVVIGAPDAGENDQGQVYIFFGRFLEKYADEGIVLNPDNANVTISGEGGGDFGHSVARAGPWFDREEVGYIDELVIGDPVNDKAYLFHGRAEAEWGEVDSYDDASKTFEGEEGSEFGYSVGGRADFTGNEYSEIFIGAPGEDSDRGKVYVYEGGEALPGSTYEIKETVSNKEADIEIIGKHEGDRFGHSLAGILSISDDGNPTDLIVGAPYAPEDGSTGRAYIFTGGEGSDHPDVWDLSEQNADVTLVGEEEGDEFGWSVHSAGDVDNTDHGDVIVGAPGWEHETEGYQGRAYVYLGQEDLVELQEVNRGIASSVDIDTSTEEEKHERSSIEEEKENDIASDVESSRESHPDFDRSKLRGSISTGNGDVPVAEDEDDLITPDVTTDEDGNIYVTWVEGSGDYDGDGNLYFSKSTDGGETFEATLVEDDHEYIEPRIAVYDDYVHIVATDPDYGDHGSVDYFRCDDGGEDFSLEEYWEDSIYPDIDVDEEGYVYLVFQSWFYPEGLGVDESWWIKNVFSDNDGDSWSDGIFLGRPADYLDDSSPALAVEGFGENSYGHILTSVTEDDMGDFHIEWFKISNYGDEVGRDLADNQIISDGYDQQYALPGGLAIDEDDEIHVAFTRVEDDNYDVSYMHSEDGTSWDETQITDDEENHGLPVVTTDSNDDPYLAWYGWDNEDEMWKALFTYSEDGGDFSDHIEIHDDSEGDKQWPGLSLYEDGDHRRFDFVWQDERDDNFDIYYRGINQYKIEFSGEDALNCNDDLPDIEVKYVKFNEEETDQIDFQDWVDEGSAYEYVEPHFVGPEENERWSTEDPENPATGTIEEGDEEEPISPEFYHQFEITVGVVVENCEEHGFPEPVMVEYTQFGDFGEENGVYEELGEEEPGESTEDIWVDCGGNIEWDDLILEDNQRWKLDGENSEDDIGEEDASESFVKEYYHQYQIEVSTTGGYLDPETTTMFEWDDHFTEDNEETLYDDKTITDEWMDCGSQLEVEYEVEPSKDYVRDSVFYVCDDHIVDVEDIVDEANNGYQHTFLFHAEFPPDVTITGPDRESEFGYSVTGGEDFEGEGPDDIIIGDPAFDNDRGKTYTFYSDGTWGIGDELYADIHDDVYREGEETGDRFGHSLSGPGDLLDIGKTSVLIGAPHHETDHSEGGDNGGRTYLHEIGEWPELNIRFEHDGELLGETTIQLDQHDPDEDDILRYRREIDTVQDMFTLGAGERIEMILQLESDYEHSTVTLHYGSEEYDSKYEMALEHEVGDARTHWVKTYEEDGGWESTENWLHEYDETDDIQIRAEVGSGYEEGIGIEDAFITIKTADGEVVEVGEEEIRDASMTEDEEEATEETKQFYYELSSGDLEAGRYKAIVHAEDQEGITDARLGETDDKTVWFKVVNSG